MTKNKQKLELTWIGKGQEMNLEPRILVENPEKSYGDPNTENMLIHGDNLLALKALEQNYTGKIKCIYIDPPYNTGSAFEHYDDNVEHSKWLSLMKVRLEILKNLLADDGCIFVQIDDSEQAYLKVLMDEIFGRNNFICNFIWEARSGQGNTVGLIAEQHEYILCFGKNINLVNFKKIMNKTEKGNYSDAKGNYKREQLRQWGQGDRREDRPTMYYPVIAPDGTTIYPFRPDGSDGRWRVSQQKMLELINNNDVDFVKDKDNRWLCYKKIRDGRVTYSAYGTFLLKIGTASTATIELKEIFSGNKVFDTPKPESLLKHFINISTNENDFILDSFLGSGTTAAVAQKMNRKWIGIELGEHCYTACEPRLQKVVDGTDQGGISKAVNWQGGGGYKFYELAPSLLKKDEFDNWIIDSRYDAEMLAEAMAKQEGYRFSPDEENIYKQGYSTEKDFIFTTTQFLSIELLDKIYSKLKADESLLICATHFEEGTGGKYDNITVKKIPQMLLNRCEFGKLEYNLNIIDPPQETEDDEEILEDENE